MSFSGCCAKVADDAIAPDGAASLTEQREVEVTLEDFEPTLAPALVPPEEAPPAKPASEGAAPKNLEAAAPKDLEAAAVAPAPAAMGRTGWSSEQERLRSEQKHPDAAFNVVSTLEPTVSCLCSVCLILIFIMVVLLILPVVLLKVVLVLLVLPLWCLAPGCLLGCCGEEAQHNFDPKFMLPSSSGLSTSVPAQLQGVFYMRNNPLDDDLVCMERGTWDDARKVLTLPVYVARAWSFKTKIIAFALLVAVRLLRYRYKMAFKTDACGKLTEAESQLQLFCFTVPKSILLFGMTDVSHAKDGSLWERWSIVFGRPIFSYWLERIMDSQGNTIPKYWEHVKSEVPDSCICISS